eukprot:3825574-Rhodomonas_salina.2
MESLNYPPVAASLSNPKACRGEHGGSGLMRYTVTSHSQELPPSPIEAHGACAITRGRAYARKDLVKRK